MCFRRGWLDVKLTVEEANVSVDVWPASWSESEGSEETRGWEQQSILRIRVLLVRPGKVFCIIVLWQTVGSGKWFFFFFLHFHWGMSTSVKKVRTSLRLQKKYPIVWGFYAHQEIRTSDDINDDITRHWHPKCHQTNFGRKQSLSELDLVRDRLGSAMDQKRQSLLTWLICMTSFLEPNFKQPSVMFLPGEPDAGTAKGKSVFTAARLYMQFAISVVWYAGCVCRHA